MLVEEDEDATPAAGRAAPSAAALGVTAEQPETSEPSRASEVMVSAQRRVIELTAQDLGGEELFGSIAELVARLRTRVAVLGDDEA